MPFTAIYGSLQSKTTVYDRILPCTIQKIYDRNTEPCNTAKYGEILSYTIENERIRSYTNSVKLDLGSNDMFTIYRDCRNFLQL